MCDIGWYKSTQALLVGVLIACLPRANATSFASFETTFDAIPAWNPRHPTPPIPRAHPGWAFDRWTGPVESPHRDTVLRMHGDVRVMAHFHPLDAPPVVINEIHYNPLDSLQGEDEDWEFVELYNPSDQSVNLAGFQFVRGIDVTFPDGTLLAPRDFLVVAANAESYRGKGYPVLQWTSGRLANEGEALVLFDSQNQPVDSVAFDDRLPWPEAADGDGPSIELTDPGLDNTLASSWAASGPLGGTPGKPNSGTPTPNEPGAKPQPRQVSLDVYPNPFVEVLTVRGRSSEPGPAILEVFDTVGRRVARLPARAETDGSFSATWDGRSDSGIPAGPGVYVVRVVAPGAVHAVPVVRLR